MDQKQGAVGEYCSGNDEECREGLVCEQGVCQTGNNSIEACSQVCDRFGECERPLGDCELDCQKTLLDWSKDVTEEYASCYEETSCEQIQDAADRENYSAPNLCYEQLELPEERRQRCTNLKNTAESCLEDVSGDYEDRVRKFSDACHRKARTVNDEKWSQTDSCNDHASASPVRCGQMFGCINDTFPLETDFPTSNPE
jgi:hypothetical protein